MMAGRRSTGDGNAYFEGEIEPCINGQVAAAGAYFGQDVVGLIGRLLGEQLDDGGWNCEAENGSTRGSFNTTICVLEALLAYEQLADGGMSSALASGRTSRRCAAAGKAICWRDTSSSGFRSTGEVIAEDRMSGADWTQFSFPGWWQYDVLRGLESIYAARGLSRTRGCRRRLSWCWRNGVRMAVGLWMRRMMGSICWIWVSAWGNLTAGSRCARCGC